ncbi:acyl transferase 1-like [Phragmites australis]|uniref:acyl transferase 1-like n=1 Tax=Phragmites australis TaxID=29695 RepID=UPI002D78C17A|nr:acyl transferase 1-like [Phragmites australis]
MLSFKARRSEPELVSPARPTPRETKALSDLDDQRTLRYYETVIGFFRSRPGHRNRPDDPAKAIKVGLAEALVYYYPVAGRLREAAGGKLVVDCTAEGVVFVEAEADARLEEFGKPLLPPYPCVEELLCDAGETRAVIGKPLLLMQVTRLKCCGFVIGFHMCHNIADGFGMVQFIRTIAELARGEALPTIFPIWERDLLTAHKPSLITHSNVTYKPLPNGLDNKSDDVMLSTPPEHMIVQYFLFGPREMAALRSHIRGYSANSTTAFELLTAIMWRCRTIALGYKSNQRVRLMITMNARGKWNQHTIIPRGYYGNAHFSPIVEATVDELCRQPLAHTVELVRKTKLSVTKKYMKSMVDTISLTRQWPPLAMMDRMYEVSDTKWIAANVITRFGWAELVGGGIPLAGDLTSKLGSDHMRCKNEDGELSTTVSMLLPRPAMERFKNEMAVWLNKHDEKNSVILSSL